MQKQGARRYTQGMVRLDERPIAYIDFDGRKIALRPWAQNVIRVQRVLQDNTFSPRQKIDISLRLLVKRRLLLWPFKRKEALLSSLVGRFISPGSKTSGKPLMDFEHDAWAIYAAFRQAYGIDLHKERLHWWVFLDLLRALPDDTKFAQIVGVRAQPMPPATKYNAAERQRLSRLKAQYALRDKKSAEDGLKSMAEMMMTMARG